MSRQESDREDLLREATALVNRAEVLLPDRPEPVVAGFRRNGCASFFFGADPVLQFNSRGELRRAYYQGRLLKAEEGRLVAMRRERTATETILRRTDLSADEQTQFLQTATTQLQDLQEALLREDFQLVGEVSTEGAVLLQIMAWLQSISLPLTVAQVPNAV